MFHIFYSLLSCAQIRETEYLVHYKILKPNTIIFVEVRNYLVISSPCYHGTPPKESCFIDDEKMSFTYTNTL